MKNKHVRYLAFSLAASIFINCFLATMPLFFDPTQYALSIMARIAHLLGTPAGMITERLLPGHGGEQIALILGSSILFYTAVFWAVLTAFSFICGKRSQQDNSSTIRK